MHKIIEKQGDISIRVDYVGGSEIKSAVYQCECGRCQNAKHPQYLGGITKDSALKYGWELINGEWQCPFCSESESRLEEIFNAPPPSLH